MTTSRRRAGDTLDDPEAIVARLRAEGHTVGHVRRQILDAVHTEQHAFTAEELADSLADVHVSTVYRTLGLLEEIGVVEHVHLSHGPAMYERAALAGTTRHLVCEVCGRHLAVPAEVFDGAARTLERDYEFVLDGVHFAIAGRCTGCVGSTADGARPVRHG